MVFYKISSIEPAADYLAKVIGDRLSQGQRVLWLVTGGSGVKVATEVGKKLEGSNLSKLAVTLTDERYVPVGDKDSNWQQLLDLGFKLTGAQLYPALTGENRDQNTQSYAKLLEKLLAEADYKIGLFGMGPDGHVAALFPNFPQLEERESFAASLDNSPKPPPLRMTMTVPAIKKLDEAVIYAVGEEKWSMLDKLEQALPVSNQPAQILKELPKLSVYNDYKGGEL